MGRPAAMKIKRRNPKLKIKKYSNGKRKLYIIKIKIYMRFREKIYDLFNLY